MFVNQNPLYLKKCKYYKPGFIIEKINKKAYQTKYDLFIFFGSREGKMNFDLYKKVKFSAWISFDLEEVGYHSIKWELCHDFEKACKFDMVTEKNWNLDKINSCPGSIIRQYIG